MADLPRRTLLTAAALAAPAAVAGAARAQDQAPPRPAAGKPLSGKVTLVTGGNGGIGLGFAMGVARMGGDVAIWARNAEKNASAKAQLEAAIQKAGGHVVAAACIVDRSGGRADVGVPLVALATLDVPAYPADALPPELAALPVEDPGSRRLSK